MNLTQNKKYLSYNSLNNYFEEYGARLATITPGIVDEIEAFNALFSKVDPLLEDMDENCVSATIYKDDFKTECKAGVWRLVTAMKYYYALTKNTVAASGV